MLSVLDKSDNVGAEDGNMGASNKEGPEGFGAQRRLRARNGWVLGPEGQKLRASLLPVLWSHVLQSGLFEDACRRPRKHRLKSSSHVLESTPSQEEYLENAKSMYASVYSGRWAAIRIDRVVTIGSSIGCESCDCAGHQRTVEEKELDRCWSIENLYSGMFEALK